jgi:hypothetical protein
VDDASAWQNDIERGFHSATHLVYARTYKQAEGNIKWPELISAAFVANGRRKTFVS